MGRHFGSRPPACVKESIRCLPCSLGPETTSKADTTWDITSRTRIDLFTIYIYIYMYYETWLFYMFYILLFEMWGMWGLILQLHAHHASHFHSSIHHGHVSHVSHVLGQAFRWARELHDASTLWTKREAGCLKVALCQVPTVKHTHRKRQWQPWKVWPFMMIEDAWWAHDVWIM